MFYQFTDEIVVALVITSLGIIWGVCIDTAKRWSFLGFIPTVIAIPFEKEKDKIWVLLQKVKGEWGFPQGRLQRAGLVHSLGYMLSRELGLQPNDYKNSPFVSLGILKFSRPRDAYTSFTSPAKGKIGLPISNIDPYTSFSLFSPRGKGYMYTVCACKLHALEKRILEHSCYEVEERKIVSIEEAAELLKGHPKIAMYNMIFEDLKALSSPKS